MSERKKIKATKSKEEIDILLSELKGVPQTADKVIHERLSGKISELIDQISDETVTQPAIQSIIEIMRILAPKSILSSSEVDVFFEKLFLVIQTCKIDLSPLIHYRIPALLKNKTIINKFFASYTKVTYNRDYLEDILSIFIDESNEKSHLINQILHLSPFPTHLICKVFDHVDLSLVTDEEYTNIFINCHSLLKEKLKEHEIRLIKGRNKTKFVECAINVNLAEVSKMYANDRDRHIRSIIAKNCSDPQIFKVLVNDPDEEVRISLLTHINWKDSRFDISDRILDKSFNVRELVFKIYKEIQFILRDSNLFERKCLKNGEIHFGSSEPVECSELTVIFKSLVFRTLEGCLTVHRSEYLNLLKSSSFSYLFLEELRSKKGSEIFLKTLTITSYKEVPKNHRGICLEYMYNGELSNDEIKECISDNVFEVLRFISDPSPFLNTLIEKALSIENFDIIEEIVNKIKSNLSKMKYLASKKDKKSLKSDHGSIILKESESFITEVKEEFELFDRPNLYFINAFTLCPKDLIEAQHGLYSYPSLYFLSHQDRNSPKLKSVFRAANLKTEQLIKLLVILDNYEYLEIFSNDIANKSIGTNTLKSLQTTKTVLGALIYFLVTGLVSIKNSKFFIKTIKLASCLSNKEAIDSLYRKYVEAVDQDTFNVFNTICWALKCHKFCNIESVNFKSEGFDSSFIVIRNNVSISDNTTIENNTNSIIQDQAAKPESKKLNLTLRDEMLHNICDRIISLRKGEIVDFTADYTRFGFIKMNENELEMIRYKQVKYE